MPCQTYIRQSRHCSPCSLSICLQVLCLHAAPTLILGTSATLPWPSGGLPACSSRPGAGTACGRALEHDLSCLHAGCTAWTATCHAYISSAAIACASSDLLLCVLAAPDLDQAVQVMQPIVQVAENMLRDTTTGEASTRLRTGIHTCYVAAMPCCYPHAVSRDHVAGCIEVKRRHSHSCVRIWSLLADLADKRNSVATCIAGIHIMLRASSDASLPAPHSCAPCLAVLVTPVRWV